MGDMFYLIVSTRDDLHVFYCVCCVVEIVRICSRLLVPFGYLSESKWFSLGFFFKLGSILPYLPDLILVLFSAFVLSLLKVVLIF